MSKVETLILKYYTRKYFWKLSYRNATETMDEGNHDEQLDLAIK